MTARKILVVVIAIVVVGVLALVPLPDFDRTRVANAIVIARAPEAVFAYVTTPGNWPKWHPASRAVRGATDHPLEVGEQVTEDFLVAGHGGTVVWTVVRRDAPRQWVIEGNVDGRDAGVITYTLTPVAGGTRFERELVYPSPNLVFALLNRISIRSRVEDESARAVSNLKRALESAPPR